MGAQVPLHIALRVTLCDVWRSLCISNLHAHLWGVCLELLMFLPEAFLTDMLLRPDWSCLGRELKAGKQLLRLGNRANLTLHKRISPNHCLLLLADLKPQIPAGDVAAPIYMPIMTVTIIKTFQYTCSKSELSRQTSAEQDGSNRRCSEGEFQPKFDLLLQGRMQNPGQECYAWWMKLGMLASKWLCAALPQRAASSMLSRACLGRPDMRWACMAAVADSMVL